MKPREGGGRQCPGSVEGQPALAASAIVKRYITEIRTMPRGRKPDGEHALSNAERQARYRTRQLTPPSPVATRTPRPTDQPIKSAGCSRPRRWRNAVIELLTLQTEHANWLAALPDSLPTAPLPTRSRPSSISTSLALPMSSYPVATAVTRAVEIQNLGAGTHGKN